MATTDTTASKSAESGSDGDAKATSGDSPKGTRRKLSDAQEREVTRLYAATETPVSEISKRFGIGESSVYRVAQRHGAALRGRTATSAKSTGRPAKVAKAATAKVAKVAKTAAKAAAGTGRGTRGRGRAAGTAKTAKTAKTAVKSAKTATKTAAKSAKTAKTAKTAAKTSTRGNGRRTRATAAPAKRTTALAVRGPGAKRAARGTRGGANAARREFRVSYVAVRVFAAANMADAIRQAEAAGATDITGIERRA
jgi:transposase-like protein